MGGQADPILKVKAISLFSGGLDSILAVKLIQEQEIDIEGVTFETPFLMQPEHKSPRRSSAFP